MEASIRSNTDIFREAHTITILLLISSANLKEFAMSDALKSQMHLDDIEDGEVLLGLVLRPFYENDEIVGSVLAFAGKNETALLLVPNVVTPLDEALSNLDYDDEVRVEVKIVDSPNGRQVLAVSTVPHYIKTFPWVALPRPHAKDRNLQVAPFEYKLFNRENKNPGLQNYLARIKQEYGHFFND